VPLDEITSIFGENALHRPTIQYRMTTDILELNDFVVIIDKNESPEVEVLECQFDADILGIVFYGSGEVDINVTDGRNQYSLQSQGGRVLSYSGTDQVKFIQKISPNTPLRSLGVFCTITNLMSSTTEERSLFEHHLADLLVGDRDFNLGSETQMTPEMHAAMAKIFENSFEGAARSLFLKGQVLELLSHYFHQMGAQRTPGFHQDELDKLNEAKEIITQNIEKPPTLSELARQIGMSNSKLQKRFKEIFGVPVFKYLQSQRLQKAHQLLTQKTMSVQEVAWEVGYESLSSFSNAFHDQYGCRPSKIMK